MLKIPSITPGEEKQVESFLNLARQKYATIYTIYTTP